jgi:hypothetical protein
MVPAVRPKFIVVVMRQIDTDWSISYSSLTLKRQEYLESDTRKLQKNKKFCEELIRLLSYAYAH